ncbi:MFS transporter [Microbacterium sp. AZCO]|uniref:MFS transporter n=1 Tax=Microbacterium sp. AZCO TaxID=3142976 RepID=UPI0031F3988A
MATQLRPRLGLAALAVSQVVTWGVLYYAILVAAPAIAADTGWGEETIFLIVTAALLTSAACAAPAGHWLDHHPRRIMLVGAVTGTVAVLATAAAPNVGLFATAWIIGGAAQSAILYQAAFTVITHRHGQARRTPLTIITLAGGLASTFFAPITGWLVSETGWRVTFVVLAGTLAVVVIPAYALTVERSWASVQTQTDVSTAAPTVITSMRFWLLTLALALLSFSLYSVTLSAVPASAEKGLDLQAASWVLGLIGAGQVLGRLVYLAIPHGTAPWIAATAVGVAGAGFLAGYAIAAQPGWIIATAIVTGAIRGALTLVQASAVSDRWGTTGYGRLNGTLAAPVAALTALAPGTAATVATTLGSYQAMGLLMAAVCLTGGLLAVRR